MHMYLDICKQPNIPSKNKNNFEVTKIQEKGIKTKDVP